MRFRYPLDWKSRAEKPRWGREYLKAVEDLICFQLTGRVVFVRICQGSGEAVVDAEGVGVVVPQDPGRLGRRQIALATRFACFVAAAVPEGCFGCLIHVAMMRSAGQDRRAHSPDRS